MDLSKIGEFGLIEQIERLFSKQSPSLEIPFEGIGDDCALLEKDEKSWWLLSTDMLNEGIHFLRDRMPAHDLGYKSLAVNLSDIAAQGGVPFAALLSLGFPKDMSTEWAMEFLKGFEGLARSTGTLLLGGDTTATLKHISISVVVIGICDKDKVKRRFGAQPGDLVCVTSPLGDSAAGLQCLLQKKESGEVAQQLIEKHFRPRPHLKEGVFLSGEESVRGMMDVSDGIDSDLKQMSKASKCRFQIEFEKIPLSRELIQISSQLGFDPVEMALTGGEDYCLVFTVSADALDSLKKQYEENFGRPFYIIGKALASAQSLDTISYLKKGKPVKLSRHGFDHFGSS